MKVFVCHMTVYEQLHMQSVVLNVVLTTYQALILPRSRLGHTDKNTGLLMLIYSNSGGIKIALINGKKKCSKVEKVQNDKKPSIFNLCFRRSRNSWLINRFFFCLFCYCFLVVLYVMNGNCNKWMLFSIRSFNCSILSPNQDVWGSSWFTVACCPFEHPLI